MNKWILQYTWMLQYTFLIINYGRNSALKNANIFKVFKAQSCLMVAL